MSLFEALVAPKVIKMRPFQEAALQRIEAAIDRGSGRGLLVLPTGTGKTSVFAELCRRLHAANSRVRILVIAHQIELLEQASQRIREMVPGVIVSIESGEQSARYGSTVIVAGVQSLQRGAKKRLGNWRPDVIIVDEAHHAAADGYQRVFEELGVYSEFGPYLLGVTATPHRMDNKPLHGSDVAIFEEVLYSYTLRQAIADGWLCDVRGFRVAAEGLDLRSVKRVAGDFNKGQLQNAMNRAEITAFAYKTWRDIARDRRTIIFCTGISHAAEVARYFNAQGVRAASLDGTIDPAIRTETLKRFRSGDLQVLANMQLLTEGVDVPEIDCVLMLRPTQSWALYTQMIGRGLRIAPSKRDCIVMDIVGNSDAHDLSKIPPVGLASVFDLPPGVDLEGKLMSSAIQAVEALNDNERAALFKRVVPLSNFGQLQQVDLLGELSEVDELTKASKFAWLKLGDDLYHLNCGARRCAVLRSDPLGRFCLRLIDEFGGFDMEIVLSGSRDEAFEIADARVVEQFPDVYGIANRSSRWRTDPATENQIVWLQKAGFRDEQITRMTKADATNALSKYFATRKTKRRRK